MFLMLGIAVFVMGLIAIFVPLATAVAVSNLIGIVLLLAGIFQVASAIRRHESAARVLLGLVISAFYVIAGLILLAHPFAAVASLTLFIGGFLVVAGVFKIVGALEMIGQHQWGWALVGGILSLILGILIWAHWPSSAVWAIGLLVGIDLLYVGWALIALSLVLHALPGATAGRLAGQH